MNHQRRSMPTALSTEERGIVGLFGSMTDDDADTVLVSAQHLFPNECRRSPPPCPARSCLELKPPTTRFSVVGTENLVPGDETVGV